jgi:hypothetical protein
LRPFDDQLTTGRADVSPSALPYRNGDIAFRKNASELIDGGI